MCCRIVCLLLFVAALGLAGNFAESCRAQSSVVSLGPSDQSIAVSVPTVHSPVPHTMPPGALNLERRLSQTTPPQLIGRFGLDELAARLRSAGIPVAIHFTARDEIHDGLLELIDPRLSLEANLQNALMDYELAMALTPDSLVLVTPSEAQRFQLTVTYDATRLGADAVELEDLIIMTIDPDNWAIADGMNEIRRLNTGGRTLITVSAPWEIHREVRRLLEGIGGLAGAPLWPAHIAGSAAMSLGSSPVLLPPAPQRRGIAVPGSNISGGLGGGFGGGMFNHGNGGLHNR